jgi:uncharacterized protein (TIGR03435 family)
MSMILLEPANTILHLTVEIKRRTISLTALPATSAKSQINVTLPNLGQTLGVAYAGHMKSRFGTSVLSLLLVPAYSHLTQAQEPQTAAESLAFEVATVKPVDPHTITEIDVGVYPGGHLVIHAHRLAMLIAEAFDIPEWEITGGDESVVQAWYDIEGKPSEELRSAMSGSEHSETSIQNPQIRSMLQSLLIERFHLEFHRENQPGTVYQLVRGDGPLRIKPAEITIGVSPERLVSYEDAPDITGIIVLTATKPVHVQRTSMVQLANKLANIRRAPVIDKTGLSGFYDFTSRTIVANEDFEGEGPTHLIVDTLPEMGLKLVKAQGQVERFVIENADLPAAN